MDGLSNAATTKREGRNNRCTTSGNHPTAEEKKSRNTYIDMGVVVPLEGRVVQKQSDKRPHA